MAGLAQDLEFLKIISEEELRRKHAILKPDDVTTLTNDVVGKYNEGNAFCLQEMKLLEAVALKLLEDWKRKRLYRDFDLFDRLLVEESEEALYKEWEKYAGAHQEGKLNGVFRGLGRDFILKNQEVIHSKFKKSINKRMKKKKTKDLGQWLVSEWTTNALPSKVSHFIMKEAVKQFIEDVRDSNHSHPKSNSNNKHNNLFHPLERWIAPSLHSSILRIRPFTFPSLMTICLNMLRDYAALAREGVDCGEDGESPLKRLFDGLDGMHMTSFNEMCEGSFEFCEILSGFFLSFSLFCFLSFPSFFLQQTDSTLVRIP